MKASDCLCLRLRPVLLSLPPHLPPSLSLDEFCLDAVVVLVPQPHGPLPRGQVSGDEEEAGAAEAEAHADAALVAQLHPPTHTRRGPRKCQPAGFFHHPASQGGLPEVVVGACLVSDAAGHAGGLEVGEQGREGAVHEHDQMRRLRGRRRANNHNHNKEEDDRSASTRTVRLAAVVRCAWVVLCPCVVCVRPGGCGR